MFLSLSKKTKYILVLIMTFMVSFQAALAAGPPAPSLFSNPLALILIILMILLLIIIGILAGILVGAADVKLKNRKKENSSATASVLLVFLLLSSLNVFAQEVGADTATAMVAKTIGGMPASTFYIMATVIFLELGLIIAMLINIRFLLKNEKEKLVVLKEAESIEAKKNKLSWWDRVNKLRPVSQEAELDLGHEYDGIRELNNKLPPWWLYGFYLSIIFAVVYMWRFHVSHTGPSSQQEYQMSVAKAELKIQEYLKAKGDAVDENTVTLLTSSEDMAAGKVIYMKSCASCHTESGAGNVGPNLTDNYWIYGNDVKSVFKVIRYGINAMPQWQNTYSNKQLAQVTSYIKTLVGSNPPNAKAPQGTEMKDDAPVANPVADSSAVKAIK